MFLEIAINSLTPWPYQSSLCEKPYKFHFDVEFDSRSWFAWNWCEAENGGNHLLWTIPIWKYDNVLFQNAKPVGRVGTLSWDRSAGLIAYGFD
jgi:hypothetical protein